MSAPESNWKKVLDELEAPRHLFVLGMASLSILYEKYTGTVYENEVHVQEISSLTRITRDVEDAVERSKAAELRRTRALSDLGGESIREQIPSWLYFAVPAFAVLAIIGYGTYSGQITDWGASIGSNASFIYALVIVLLALAIYLMVRRRRRKSRI